MPSSELPQASNDVLTTWKPERNESKSSGCLTRLVMGNAKHVHVASGLAWLPDGTSSVSCLRVSQISSKRNASPRTRLRLLRMCLLKYQTTREVAPRYGCAEYSYGKPTVAVLYTQQVMVCYIASLLSDSTPIFSAERAIVLRLIAMASDWPLPLEARHFG